MERLRQERDAGRVFKLSDLDPLEWELLIHWTLCEAAHREAHETRIRILFEALMKSTKRN